ncbi:Bcr/CflA family multidrug efflux MFS transporter [Parasulfuritortus cantonensis]|uniref:Bcr/CflA family efflux transporter n=1 Tax=Parasulfuritortus cantonensis TaxID=2528202 RepID=A0A4R1BGP8_9PROT|nr:Bcr/CflA family multidrug efflux MFS transporter [Parasulfuritortus cantonensis]TCJ16373.1 Bcr/CflA family multidrug efflux MFS transporter [Parasulfuritortus cantonensis]
MSGAGNCGRGLPAWLVLLGALTAIGPLSIDMYLPGFPAMTADFAGQAGRPEYTLAGYFVGTAFGQLIYGPLSDRYGRKPPLYAGLALYTLASLAGALATGLGELTFWRLTQGLGGCAGMVVTRAVIRDRCGVRDSARAMSLLMLVMGVAPIVAPMLGGWVVASLGWRAIFCLLTGFGLACLLAIRLGLAESHDTRHAPPLGWRRLGEDFGALLGERAFMGYSLASGFAMAGFFAYISGSPHVFMELYHLSTEQYGWLFASNAVGFILASQINARLIRRLEPTRVLRRAQTALALLAGWLALLPLAGQPGLVAFAAPLTLAIASLGFIVPNATAAALATHGQRAGTASALMGALQFGLATLAGSLTGLAQGAEVAPLAWIIAACALAAWLTHHALIRAPAH